VKCPKCNGKQGFAVQETIAKIESFEWNGECFDVSGIPLSKETTAICLDCLKSIKMCRTCKYENSCPITGKVNYCDNFIEWEYKL